MTWLADGVELNGFATDVAFGAGGKVIPAVVAIRIHLARQDNRLVVTDRWQNYEVATGPDGEALLAPDFKKPLGDTYHWLEGKSRLPAKSEGCRPVSSSTAAGKSCFRRTVG